MCKCKSSYTAKSSDSACSNLHIKYNIEGVAKISVLSPELNGNRLAGEELESWRLPQWYSLTVLLYWCKQSIRRSLNWYNSSCIQQVILNIKMIGIQWHASPTVMLGSYMYVIHVIHVKI